MENLKPQYIAKKIKFWRNILQLDPQWKINYEIRNSSNEMSAGNEDAMACISVDLRYFIATIEFNSPEIKEQDLESVIVHELLHIILEPLSCAAGCGLGKKYEEMNSILCESTIERLVPGYLYMYKQISGKTSIRKSKSKKSNHRAMRCMHK